ncbi:MAG: hypothetical protein EHM70_24960, partial [Chloroflexota bacterium]
MKIVSNQKKINRNYKIGLYTSLASLAFLVGAVILTFYGLTRPEVTSYSFIAMIVGLILSQVGVYFANRWGKSPRVDERLSQGLKGLDERYTLYHYSTPVPHLLVGPAGIWVINPQYQSGVVTYEKNRFRQKGVGFFSKVVGQEGLGRPDLEANAYQEDFQKFLQKSLPENSQPTVRSMIVFTSPKATIQAQDAPIPTMHVEKMKDFVRRKHKEEPANL